MTVYTQYIDMHSELVISQSDGRPMYLQIMEQIRHRIAVGEWPPGQELPSIRALAVATVAINEMIGPVLFKLALDRAGESSRAEAPSLASIRPPALE